MYRLTAERYLLAAAVAFTAFAGLLTLITS